MSNYKDVLVIYTDINKDLECTNDHKVISFLKPSVNLDVCLIVGPYYL